MPPLVEEAHRLMETTTVTIKIKGGKVAELPITVAAATRITTSNLINFSTVEAIEVTGVDIRASTEVAATSNPTISVGASMKVAIIKEEAMDNLETASEVTEVALVVTAVAEETKVS